MRYFLCLAMASLLATAAVAASITTVNVEVNGATFLPANVTVHPGDKVQWLASFGGHTLVSGLGPDDPEVGRFFTGTVNTWGSSFEYTFEDLGAYPYFCLCPGHLAKTMRAIVYVAPAPVPVEPLTWGGIKALFAP